MRVLVACEESGTVREAFKKKGHDAWSCDLLPTRIPGQHYHGFLEDFIGSGREWDLIIAHPPCTYLSSSGLHWNKRNPERAKKTEHALAFVQMILNRDCGRIALENPVGCIGTRIRPADQYIQPYQFGEDASKRTGLWLKGLPLLVPTKFIEPRRVNGKPRWANQTDSGQNKLGPSEDRARIRAKTYQGWADAMADQWG